MDELYKLGYRIWPRIHVANPNIVGQGFDDDDDSVQAEFSILIYKTCHSNQT